MAISVFKNFKKRTKLGRGGFYVECDPSNHFGTWKIVFIVLKPQLVASSGRYLIENSQNLQVFFYYFRNFIQIKWKYG